MFRWQNFPRVLEMDCDYTSGPDWAFSNLGAGNFQGDEVADAVWKGCYSLINRANVALNYVNQITGADEKVKANAIGELKFNKAFAYFMLTKAYGDIPMFNVAISEGSSYEPVSYTHLSRIRQTGYVLGRHSSCHVRPSGTLAEGSRRLAALFLLFPDSYPATNPNGRLL